MKQSFFAPQTECMITTKVFITTLIIASSYVLVTIYMMNGNLVKDTLLGNFPIDYKFNLMIALLQGMWTAMSGAGLFILFTTALLTGINLTLIFKRFSLLRSTGNIHFTVGGGSLLGFVGSGCAACGLPVLSLLGLTGSVVYLPFRGTELSLIAVALLTMSLYIMIKSNSQKIACAVNLRTNHI